MSGTRFSCRGVDDQGNASNFVETEEILVCHQWLFSHVSLRGSAPFYWTQAKMGAEIKFPQENENEVIIKKHFDYLKKTYNCDVVTVNLLSKTKSP